jgi:hypothetical protein
MGATNELQQQLENTLNHGVSSIFVKYVLNIKVLMTTREYKVWLSGSNKEKEGNKCRVLLL